MTGLREPRAVRDSSNPEITEWTVPWARSRPRDPYVAADGRVWFVGAERRLRGVPRYGTRGIHPLRLPDGAAPHNLIVGAAHVWYAGNGDAHIGKLDPPTGDIEVIPMPDPTAIDPHTLVFDQGGDIWFTVQKGNFVGQLTPATEAVRLIEVPTANARLRYQDSNRRTTRGSSSSGPTSSP